MGSASLARSRDLHSVLTELNTQISEKPDAG